MEYKQGGLSLALFGLAPTKQTTETRLPQFLTNASRKPKEESKELTSLPPQSAKESRKAARPAAPRPPTTPTEIKDAATEERTSKQTQRSKRKHHATTSGGDASVVPEGQRKKRKVKGAKLDVSKTKEADEQKSGEEEPSQEPKLAESRRRKGDQKQAKKEAKKGEPQAKGSTEAQAVTDESSEAERPLEELKRTVCLRNLPVDVKAKNIYKFLSLKEEDIETIRFRSVQVDPKFANNKIGGIITKAYVKNATKSCYVVLKDIHTADKLLLLNGTKWAPRSDQTIFIDKPPLHKKFSLYDKRCTVFVGRLPKSADEAKLMHWFGAVGNVKHVRIVRDPKTQESKGFGFVCFESKSAVPQAIRKFAKFEINGHPLRVTRPLSETEAQDQKERRSAKGTRGKKVPTKTIKKPAITKKPAAGAARRVANKKQRKASSNN